VGKREYKNGRYRERRVITTFCEKLHYNVGFGECRCVEDRSDDTIEDGLSKWSLLYCAVRNGHEFPPDMLTKSRVIRSNEVRDIEKTRVCPIMQAGYTR
jgi:hypothetical protein